MATEIKVSQLAAAVAAALDEEKAITDEVVAEAVKQTASATVKEIRANARAAFPDGSGDYPKSWAQKAVNSKVKDGKVIRFVYAKSPGSRIAHLLENGHAKVNGGRVEGRPHIAPAATKAAQMLTDLIKKGLERGGL